MRYDRKIEQFFHSLANLKELAEKVLVDGVTLTKVENNAKDTDLDKLYKIGLSHGQTYKQVTTLLLRSIWELDNRQTA